MTTEPGTPAPATSPAPPATPPRRRPRLRFAVVAFLVTLIATSGLLAGAAVVYADAYQSRVMPGVSVAGIDLGGLDRDDARARLLSTLPDPTGGSITLTVDDAEVVVPYAELDRRYEVESALDAAMGIGRSGSAIDRSADQIRALTRGVRFDVDLVAYDRAALDARVDELVASLERTGRDASVRLASGATGASWVVEPSQTGVDVDEDALKTAAHAALAALGTGTASTRVSVAARVIEPVITTDEAQTAADRAQGATSTPLSLAAGDTDVTIDVQTLRGWLSVEPDGNGGYDVSLDGTGIEPLLTEALAEVGTPATDATFRFADGGGIEAVPGSEGVAVDLAATTARVVEALEGRLDGAAAAPVEVATTVTEPRFTTAEAQAAAPRVRRISRWTTYFQVYEGNYWGRNISVPTRKLDKMTVAPGRWFDFLKAIGAITRAAGYGPGGAIINGRTETTGALGGGMCSCSTTIFNAALRAGFQMGQRRNHYYYIDRYPVGLDATVWQTSPGKGLSMRFRNDTDYPALIRGIYRRGMVRFEIWTVPTGRRVSLSPPVIRQRTNARDTIEYTDSLAPGTRRRVEYPTDGFKSWVTRVVRDRDGNVIHEDTFFSHYKAVDGVTLVGVAPGDPRDGDIVVVGG